MSDEARNIAERWFEEVWNQQQRKTIDDLASPAAEFYAFNSPENAKGRDGLRADIEHILGNFSDVSLSVLNTVAEGKMVAVRWRIGLTHTGPAFGIPPTNERVTVFGMTLLEVEDGLILRGWDALDMTAPIMHLRATADKRMVEHPAG
jgi:predicted ester cyclase